MKIETEEMLLEVKQDSPMTVSIVMEDSVEPNSLEVILTKSQVFQMIRTLSEFYYS